LSLCLCSLLTGKLDVLPCFHGGTVRGYAVLPSPSTDHGGTPQRPADGYSNLCKVLLVCVHPGSCQLNIHSFSTAADAAAFQNWGTTPVNGFSGSPYSGPVRHGSTYDVTWHAGSFRRMTQPDHMQDFCISMEGIYFKSTTGW
jgi:hypothetical protein